MTVEVRVIDDSAHLPWTVIKVGDLRVRISQPAVVDIAGIADGELAFTGQVGQHEFSGDWRGFHLDDGSQRYAYDRDGISLRLWVAAGSVTLAVYPSGLESKLQEALLAVFER